MSQSVIIRQAAALTSSFVASDPLLIVDGRISLDFELTVATDAAVEWYLEFTDQNPNTGTWSREISEELQGNGAVTMAEVTRTFRSAGAASLILAASGSPYELDAQFRRDHKFARVQIRAASGSVTRAQITSQYGSIPRVP